MIRAVLVRGLLAIVVDPVREGRLRDKDWSPSVRAAVWVSLAAYAGFVLLVLLGGTLRGHLDLVVTGGLSLPRATVVLFFWLVVWCLSLVQTAALHVHPVARIGVLVFTVLVLLSFNGALVSKGDASQVVVYVGSALLVLLVALAWRREPAWWELPAVLVVVTTTAAVSLWSAARYGSDLGVDPVPLFVTVQMSRLQVLAVPAAIVAGLAVAELAVSTADKAVRAGRRYSRWLLPLALLLGAWRTVLLVASLGERGTTGRPVWAEVTGGLVLLALAVAVGVVLVVRSWSDAAPDTERALEEMSRLAVPVAVGLSAVLLPAVPLRALGTVARTFDRPGVDRWLRELEAHLSSQTAITASRTLIAVVLLGLAWRWSGQRRTLPALVAGVLGVVVLAVYLRAATGGLLPVWPWTVGVLVDTTAVLGVLGLTVLAATRRPEPSLVTALAAVVATACAFALGDLIDSPISTLVGLSGVGLLLYGLVWAFLTGADEANGSSPRYGNGSRVLVYLAAALFAVGVLAFSSVARASALGVTENVDQTLIGQRLLGGALLLVAWILLGWRALAEAGPSGPTGSTPRPRSLDQ